MISVEQKIVSDDGEEGFSEETRSGFGKTRTCLFSLPEEVQDLILVHLDVKDLLSCAQVSRLWRSGINSSRVWKKWCLLESFKPDLVDQCPSHFLVEDGDDFIGMGFWGKVYFWHKKLKYNWKTKRVTRYKLIQSASNVYCFDTNGEVAVTGHEDASVTVWSIQSVPFVIANLQGVLKEFPILAVRVDKDLVIVQQRKLLQVFHFADQKYKLTDLKSFEMGEDNIDQIEYYSEQESQFCTRYEECLRAHDKPQVPAPLVYNIFRNLLLVGSHHSGFVRGWSLPGSELYICIETNRELSQILTDETSLYFITRDEVTYFLRYDEEMQTASALLSVPGLKKFTLGHDLVVAIPSPGDVSLKRIWAYRRGFYSKPIATRTIRGYANVAICPYNYIVYSEDSLVTVWDPVSDETVSHFNAGPKVTCMRTTFSTFLLIFMRTSLHLWDWKTSEKLYCLISGLEWTGNYCNLLWTNATTVLSGGVDHQLEMVTFM